MKKIQLHIHTDKDSIYLTTDWNECPVGLFGPPQPEWLQEFGGDCICKCVDVSEDREHWNHQCKMFGGLGEGPKEHPFGDVICNYEKGGD